MSSAGSTGISTVPNGGRQYAILFATISGAWYAYCLYDNGTQFYGVRRWALTGSGLGTAADQNGSIGSKAAAHASLSHPYGSAAIDGGNAFGGMNGPTTDASVAYRATASDMASESGMNGWNPTDIVFPEHAIALKLSDGYLSFALDNGNTGEQNGNFGHLKEAVKTGLTDAWGTEATIEGNVTGATAAQGDFTDQNYSINSSHAGQQDICQLDSGDIYVAYCANGDLVNGNFGEIKLVKRGSAKASGWTRVSNDVIGSSGEAWHTAISTDGTNIWIFYCKDVSGVRDTAIHYRKYNVSGNSLGTEVKLADIQASHSFYRMSTQWRAGNSRIVVLWSEFDGSTNYDVMAQSVSTISSTLNISITGMTDATYKTIIPNPVDSAALPIFAANLAYTSGSASTGDLDLAVGTALTGFVIDNEVTHLNGAVITGTTV
tara:strand:+ start:164 stop:1462 length:1299 start_codon:yes stop_codon:yes gene_type:complete